MSESVREAATRVARRVTSARIWLDTAHTCEEKGLLFYSTLAMLYLVYLDRTLSLHAPSATERLREGTPQTPGASSPQTNVQRPR